MVAWRFDTIRGPVWVPLGTTCETFDFYEDKIVELASKGDTYYELDNGAGQVGATNLLPLAYFGPSEAINTSQIEGDDMPCPEVA